MTTTKPHYKPPAGITTSITDFSKFRESGELSDIIVVVGDAEYKLHKFPLFIKSDFFRALARGNITEKDRVELADFPGGPEVFEQVANFCYNMRLTVTRENVCQLRCAAEFLQMTSPDNMSDVADKFFQDVLTSAKLGRNLGAILDLLTHCQSLGDIAEQAGIVEKCILGIVDCWLVSSKFTRRSGKLDHLDLIHLDRLTEFPLNWFLQLFVTARDKCVRPAVLSTMIEMYITNALDQSPDTDDEEEEQPKQIEDSKDNEKETKNDNGDEKENGKEENQEGEKDQADDLDKEIALYSPENSETKKDEKQTDEKKQKKKAKKPVTDEELAMVLDALLLQLPDNASLAETISPQWAARMLQTAQKMGCQSRHLLLKLNACLLHKLSPEDLSNMPPELLSEILNEASKEGNDQEGSKKIKTELLCQVIDNYLLEQAKKDELSVETFSKMVQAVPSEARENHDLLFSVLETMLKSEKHCPSDADRSELLEVVDCSRLSEATLLRAYDGDLVPREYITKAAIALCGRLRQQLEESRATVKSQEEELRKYGLGRHASQSFRIRSTAEMTGASGLGSRYNVVRSSSSTFRSYSTSPRATARETNHELPSASDGYERDYCYSSTHDGLYRPRYLDTRDTTVYDTSYVDTYSDLYRPYGYYTSST